MRILIFALNYAPELTGSGRYNSELAEWFAANGQEVRVITTPPYYPEWAVHPGHRASRYLREGLRGVSVTRCPVWIPKTPSGLKRVLHQVSFVASSLPVALAQVAWKPDLVLLHEPPLACAPTARLISWLSPAKTWLHVQDLEVDAAFEQGMLSHPSARKLLLAAERHMLRWFDSISTMSNAMKRRLEDKTGRAGTVRVFRSWADTGAIRRQVGSPYRAELGIPEDAIVCLSSGTMNNKQGLDQLARVAVLLQSDPRLHFVFCGNGPARLIMENITRNLPRVTYLDLQPKSRLDDLLALADIHLLSQRADGEESAMPSKVTGMLASGRAIVATCRPESDLGQLIRTCGLTTPPGDIEALGAAIRRLADDQRLRLSMGRNARQVAEEQLSTNSVMSDFLAQARRVAGRA